MVEEYVYDILENISEAFFAFDEQMVFEYFNKSAEELLGRKRGDVLGKHFLNVFPEAKGSIFLENYEEVLKDGKERSFETFFEREPYENWYNVRVYPKKKGIMVFFQITTQQKKDEERLRKALEESKKLQSKLTALLNSSRAILEYKEFENAARSIFDSCKDIIGAQSGYIALLSEDGSENEVLFLESGGLSCTVDPELPMPIRGLRGEAYRKGEPVYNNNFAQSEYMEFMPPGHVTLERVLFAPLNIEGKTVGLMGIANKETDFTDDDAQTAASFGELAAIALMNSQTLEKLENSLDEREMLLKEIHHRVKNNLMIISSLLNLQSGYLKDKESQSIFKESQNRARSMAIIHERLYQSTDLKRIDLGEYITKLANELYRTYVADSSKIQLDLNVEDVFVDINRAIPLGLIINELITNSLTHAFPHGRTGCLKVDLHSHDDSSQDWNILLIRDNGIGFQDDLDFKKTDTLGLQLVNSLVQQIDGEITLDSENGTEFKVRFKELLK